jgi:hypothetical protein
MAATKGKAKKARKRSVRELAPKAGKAGSVKGGCQNNLLPAAQIGQLPAVQLTREAAKN